MEVLTAYVRQHARQQPAERLQGTTPTRVLPPDPDIQAIMSVLRRRTRYFGRGEPEPLDLRDTTLFRANLSGAALPGANLSGAYLWIANLSEANLEHANLTGANLFKAYLAEANLEHANLEDADLGGATLALANLTKVNLKGANLTKVNLSGANLSGAYLGGADLRGAWTRVSHFGLRPHADLKGANLTKVNLKGAKLLGVENLIQEQLEETKGDENTQLPSDLKPPAHWGVQTDEQIEEH
jgi:uncharacterized protein YjbI with pentapeptide repeats